VALRSGLWQADERVGLMGNGKWEMAESPGSSIFHLPSAIQDVLFSILVKSR